MLTVLLVAGFIFFPQPPSMMFSAKYVYQHDRHLLLVYPMPSSTISCLMNRILFYQPRLNNHITSTHLPTTTKTTSKTNNTTTINIFQHQNQLQHLQQQQIFHLSMSHQLTPNHSISLTPLSYIFLFAHHTDSSHDCTYYSLIS